MKRLIFIARDHTGEAIGIVLAESQEIANAYFIGRGESAHSTIVIDPADENLGVMGLAILFKTKVIHPSHIRERYERVRASETGLRVQDLS